MVGRKGVKECGVIRDKGDGWRNDGYQETHEGRFARNNTCLGKADDGGGTTSVN